MHRPGSHRRRRRTLGGLAAAIALLTLSPAAAQHLDQGALSALFGEPVTTSATGGLQRLSDVPVGMEIVTSDQIRRSGARDIPAILARYTSLDLQRYNTHDASVTVRGYATPMAPRLLVLVDGRQVYLDHYGYVAWDSIPVQLGEIQQIEVVKGPNAALFGFNAVAGVVNIVTFDPLRDPVSNATFRLGNGRTRESSGVLTTPFGERGSVRLSAALRAEDAWRRGYTDFERNDLGAAEGPRRGQFALRAAFRPVDNVRLSFDAGYSRASGSDYYDYGQVWPQDKRVWNLGTRLAVDTHYGLVEAALYHNGFRATYRETVNGTDHGLTALQLSTTAKLGADHTVRPFVEARHSVMRVSPGSELGLGLVAAGAMWNWAVTDRFSTTVALRRDEVRLDANGYDDPRFPFGDRDYDRAFGATSWNLGAVWRVTDLDTIRVSAARGVGLPSLDDMGWREIYPAYGVQEVGSPYIGATYVDDYQVEYRRRIEEIGGRLSLTGFTQRNRGFSSHFAVQTMFPPAVELPTYTPVNLGSSDVSGLDVSLSGRVDEAFDWGLAYRLAVVTGELTPAPIDYKHASPRHLLTARLGWARGAWEADLFARYSSQTQGYRLVNETDPVFVTVRDHVSLAGRVGVLLRPGVTLALEGEGLLHGRQRQTTAVDAERRVFVSLRFDF
jgi:iron complex outermembrane receptor protein